MNGAFSLAPAQRPGNLPFFKFGTPPAVYWVSQTTLTIEPKETTKMTASNTANRFLAAAFSVAISAATFAYAIIPASPNLMV